jgi:hypothetical protein
MSEHFFEIKFADLRVGHVIVDFQGARHTVTAIGDWETFDDVWDPKKGDVVSEQGRRLFTDTYSEGQGYTKQDMKTVRFRIVREHTPHWER